MKALQDLWHSNPYAVAAAVVAPIVFGVTFALIWLLSSGGGGDPQSTADRQLPPATQATPAVVEVQSEPDAEAQAQQVAPARSIERASATEQQRPQAAQTPEDAAETDEVGPEADDPQVDEPVEEEALPALDDVLVEELDESSFRYGIEKERGAILPIDNGIVPSSGPDYSTSWELLLPTARIRADIVQVGRTARGAIGAPDNPFVIGWFNVGAEPGEPGNAILAGHRDYEDIDGNVGTGVCWELNRVKVGDQMVIRDAEQNIAWVYEVTEAVTLDPYDPDSARYLASTDESVVTLITCTGAFNPQTHTYSHRLVIVGVLQATASTT